MGLYLGGLISGLIPLLENGRAYIQQGAYKLQFTWDFTVCILLKMPENISSLTNITTDWSPV